MRTLRAAAFAAVMSLTAMSLPAQNTYIVKTSNAKKALAADSLSVEEDVSHDFLGENFKYYSLCDWEPGMRFMVMPEKYDLIVNTFCDAATGKEVGNGKLRHKIMVYKGHDEDADGHARVNFRCEDDGKDYYYEVPRGSFEDYCYGKLGVPTLAFLDDVDKAREKLMDATLYTKTTIYRIDTEVDGDGYEEVTVPLNERVKVKAIGVGSRSFPVKIIVEDEDGNEFYQSVAMSKTNSGMRDDEFIMDNAKYVFNASFELADADIAAAADYDGYIGKRVYTRYATTMENTAGEKVTIVRLSSFEIQKIMPRTGSNYVKMELKSVKSGEVYTKEVTFVNDDVAGDLDGYKEDYYGYIFAEGNPSKNSKK